MQRQRTKLFGLKKLKAIAKGSNAYVVSKHIVYKNSDQFRMAHAMGMPSYWLEQMSRAGFIKILIGEICLELILR